MSLINQMLRDLDRRKGTANGGMAVPPAYRKPPPGRSPALVLVFGIIVLLAAVAGWLLWDQARSTAESDMSAADAVETATPPKKIAATPPERPKAGTPQADRSKPASARPPRPPKKLAAGLPDGPKASIPQATRTQPAPAKPARTPQPEPAATARREEAPAAGASMEIAEGEIIEPADAHETGPAGTIRKSPRPVTAMQRAEEHYRRAFTLLNRGRVEAGEEALRRALVTAPGHDKARELLALVLIRSGRLVEAGEVLREGLAVHPANRQLAQILAQVLDRQGRTREAVQLLERHRPAAIGSDSAYVALLAAYYRKLNQHARAEALYRQLTAVQPDNGLWWIGLGLSLEAQDKTEAAREAFRKARDTGSLNESLRRFVAGRLDAEAPEE